MVHYDKTLTKHEEFCYAQLFQFLIINKLNIFSLFCRGDSELLASAIGNFKQNIFHGLLTCLKRDFRTRTHTN